MAGRANSIVYALGNRDDGTKVLVIGLTAEAVGDMADGLTVTFQVPAGMRNVSDVVIFAEQDKADLRRRFEETGLPIEQYPF